MNRPSITASPSVFQKASYESTMEFLSKAAISGDFDQLRSPSSALVMGKVVESGTGGFEIYQPIMNYS
jgi:DNA-directed RNA polymerase I subunit RPA1